MSEALAFTTSQNGARVDVGAGASDYVTCEPTRHDKSTAEVVGDTACFLGVCLLIGYVCRRLFQ